MLEHVIDGCLCEGKWCTKCEQVKCYDAFYKQAGRDSRSHCKECVNANARERRKVRPREPKPRNISRRRQIPMFVHMHEDCQCEGKRCKSCEKFKCVDNFYLDKQNKDGHTVDCKVCRGKRVKEWKEAHKDQVTATAAWYTKNTEQRRRRYHLKKVYGLTESQYSEMRDRQQGACAICGIVSQSPLHIDHDHSTGRVRALLCTRCNSMIGYARDSIEMLKKGIEYLEFYSEGVDDNE
jgi:hypothetical protein